MNTHSPGVSQSDIREEGSPVTPGMNPHIGMSWTYTTQPDISGLYPPGTFQGRGTL